MPIDPVARLQDYVRCFGPLSRSPMSEEQQVDAFGRVMSPGGTTFTVDFEAATVTSQPRDAAYGATVAAFASIFFDDLYDWNRAERLRLAVAFEDIADSVPEFTKPGPGEAAEASLSITAATFDALETVVGDICRERRRPGRPRGSMPAGAVPERVAASKARPAISSVDIPETLAERIRNIRHRTGWTASEAIMAAFDALEASQEPFLVSRLVARVRDLEGQVERLLRAKTS